MLVKHCTWSHVVHIQRGQGARLAHNLREVIFLSLAQECLFGYSAGSIIMGFPVTGMSSGDVTNNGPLQKHHLTFKPPREYVERQLGLSGCVKAVIMLGRTPAHRRGLMSIDWRPESLMRSTIRGIVCESRTS